MVPGKLRPNDPDWSLINGFTLEIPVEHFKDRYLLTPSLGTLVHDACGEPYVCGDLSFISDSNIECQFL